MFSVGESSLTSRILIKKLFNFTAALAIEASAECKQISNKYFLFKIIFGIFPCHRINSRMYSACTFEYFDLLGHELLTILSYSGTMYSCLSFASYVSKIINAGKN